MITDQIETTTAKVCWTRLRFFGCLLYSKEGWYVTKLQDGARYQIPFGYTYQDGKCLRVRSIIIGGFCFKFTRF